MIRWAKVSTVATFEFLAAVKRVGYLIATFGMPLFMAAYAGVVAVPAYYAEKKGREPSVYGVVDKAGVLHLSGDVEGGRPPIPDDVKRALEAAGQAQALDRAMSYSNFVFRPFDNEEDARKELAARRIKGLFVVPPDYLARGTVGIYSPDNFSFSGGDARSALSNLLRQRLVSSGLEPTMAARILDPIKSTERYAVTRTGELRDGSQAASAVRLILPLVFMFLFLLSVLMTSGYLMQGTATEKENKVVEVLLASANPDEILAGKLIGLSGAGLLQIAVWLVMLTAAGLGVIPFLLSTRVDVPWTGLAIAIPFFMVAFLFFGGLIMGTGSLGSTMREAQQLAMIWTLTAALPMMMMAVLMRDPNGTVARVMSWVPFSAGPVMVLRVSTDAASVPWWEIAGSFVVLLVSTWIALRIGARLFRIGLLSAGARPSLREIVRQARLAN